MSIENDLLWGATAIAEALGRSRRQVFYLLETRQLPAKRIGGRWVASRRRLIAALTDDNWQSLGAAAERVIDRVRS